MCSTVPRGHDSTALATVSSAAQCVDEVGRLPREVEIGAAEMPVHRKRPIETSLAPERRLRAQAEAPHDGGGAEIHRAFDAAGDVLVGNRPGAEGRDRQTQRMRPADRISEVHLAAFGKPRCNDILGGAAGGIGPDAVDARRIFAR